MEQANLKNDKTDSEILADLLRSDMISESFVPEKHYRDMHSMAKDRLELVHIILKYKNMIYAVVAKCDCNYSIKDIFSNIGLQMINKLDLSDADKMTLDTHI